MKSDRKIVHFNQGLENVLGILDGYRDSLPPTVIIIRDLYGRIRLALDTENIQNQDRISQDLHKAMGHYSPGTDNIIMFKNDLFDAAAVFESDDAIPLRNYPGRYLLDRQLTGQDWRRLPLEGDLNKLNRATLFSIKGGVGRSTALAVWAYYLASFGKKVLVLDLDLESPGIGNTLLPQDNFPTYGVLDWLIEDAVGQADESLLQDMVANSPLSGESGGSVRVVPSGGINDKNYLPKLARAYLEVNYPDQPKSFAQRLSAMLKQLEEYEKPDVTLIDSRAGLHDIAAVTVSRLNSQAFLFAVESSQTWYAYSLLFNHWQDHPALESFRDNLKMVAAMVPEVNQASYLERFKESSYKLWSESLYEETDKGSIDNFNFDLNASDAPHYPLRIDWSQRFQEFNPLKQLELLTSAHINAVYGDFLKEATRMVTGEDLE
jgi:MinD-like ATPase involved in chromosome partitioning or flagellar assembly